MSFLELLAWSVWDYLRPRKIVTMILVGSAGPLFALLLRWRISDNEYNPDLVYGMVVPLTVYSFSLVLLSIVFASGIISSEMVGRTIQYLLTRPIPRHKILLAKWLAASLVVSVTAVVSCVMVGLITHGPSQLVYSNLPRDIFILPVGAFAYCAVFTLLSVVSTKPWLFAISFGFLWESWVPFMPNDMQKVSVMAYLRVLSPQIEGQGLPDLMDFIRSLNPQTITASSAWNTIVLVTVVALALACALFSTSEFVPKEEAA